MIDGDHMSICKFKSRKDEGYVWVSGDVAELVEKAEKTQEEQGQPSLRPSREEYMRLNTSFPGAVTKLTQEEQGLVLWSDFPQVYINSSV